MPPIVGSVNKSPSNHYHPFYSTSLILKKIGISIYEKSYRPIATPKAITSNSQRLEPPNSFPGAFPTLSPFQKQLARKYLNRWKDRKIMQNKRKELAHEKFSLYLKRRAIYVWYGRLKEKQYQKKWNRKRKNLASLPDNFQPYSILKRSDRAKRSKIRFRFDQNEKINCYQPENDDQIKYIDVIEGKNNIYNEEARKEVKRALGIGNFYEEKYLYKARTTKVWKMAFEQYREGKHADQQVLKKLM